MTNWWARKVSAAAMFDLQFGVYYTKTTENRDVRLTWAAPNSSWRGSSVSVTLFWREQKQTERKRRIRRRRHGSVTTRGARSSEKAPVKYRTVSYKDRAFFSLPLSSFFPRKRADSLWRCISFQTEWERVFPKHWVGCRGFDVYLADTLWLI